jgi:hypothetical protein
LRRRKIESDFHVDIKWLRHIFFARIRAVPAKRANAAQRNRVAQEPPQPAGRQPRTIASATRTTSRCSPTS